MAFFDEHRTLRAVIDCALEGRLGSVHHDDPDAPAAARIDFGCYAIFSGDPARPVVAQWIEALRPPLEILLPDDQAWRDLVDRLLGDRCSDRTMRTFALHALDRDELQAVGIADGFRVEALDVDLVRRFNDDLRPHALDVFTGPSNSSSAGWASLRSRRMDRSPRKPRRTRSRQQASRSPSEHTPIFADAVWHVRSRRP